MRKGNGLAARRASLGKTTTPSHAVATCATMNQKIVFSRRSRPRSAIVRYAVRTTSSDTTMLTAWNAVNSGYTDRVMPRQITTMYAAYSHSGRAVRSEARPPLMSDCSRAITHRSAAPPMQARRNRPAASSGFVDSDVVSRIRNTRDERPRSTTGTSTARIPGREGTRIRSTTAVATAAPATATARPS